MLLLTEVFIGDGADEEDGVSGPFLNAGQVEEGEAPGAAPHLNTNTGSDPQESRSESRGLRGHSADAEGIKLARLFIYGEYLQNDPFTSEWRKPDESRSCGLQLPQSCSATN